MLRYKLSRIYRNLAGWRTNRKIVVIESDDWGSVRMPSKQVFEKCLKAGYPVDKISYELYDSIASEDDLALLFDLLLKYKDKRGKHPLITANCLVANPDFKKIAAGNYEKYYYELVTQTFKRYPGHHNNFNVWNKGKDLNIFYPQFHGREHINVSRFMHALKKGDQDVRFGFENGMPGCINKGAIIKGNQYVGATHYHSLDDKRNKLNIILEGLDIFEQLFGYKSKTLIPPNYIWSLDFNRAVKLKGVKYFQGIHKMREPISEAESTFHNIHLGMRSKEGQTYLVRNVTFEPSMFRLGIKDPVKQCLSEMSIAFKLKKPAVLSSHRINYVGFIDPSNRDRNLKMLDEVLKTALKRWPDIEFMSSVDLGDVIVQSES